MLDYGPPNSILIVTNSDFDSPIVLKAKIKNGQDNILNVLFLFKVASDIFSHMFFSVFFLIKLIFLYYI